MTAKKVVQGLIVTMALCLSTTTGRAADYRFFIMGGGSSLSDQRSFTEGYLPYGSNYARGGKGILGLEYPLHRIFAIEGSVAFGQNNLEISNFNTSPVTVIGYSVRNYRVSGDIIARAPSEWKSVRPYFALGLEYNDFSPTTAAETVAAREGFGFAATAKLASEGYPGANIGGGIDYKVGKKVDFRIDVRYHFTSSPTYGLPFATPTSPSIAYFPIGGAAHDIEYSIGIVYHFGREKPSTAPTKSPRPPSSRHPSPPQTTDTWPSPF